MAILFNLVKSKQRKNVKVTQCKVLYDIMKQFLNKYYLNNLFRLKLILVAATTRCYSLLQRNVVAKREYMIESVISIEALLCQSKKIFSLKLVKWHLYQVKSKGSFYIAQYPVRRTHQSAVHFLPSLADLFIPIPARLLREAF